jgi:hypothetical protein
VVSSISPTRKTRRRMVMKKFTSTDLMDDQLYLKSLKLLSRWACTRKRFSNKSWYFSTMSNTN